MLTEDECLSDQTLFFSYEPWKRPEWVGDRDITHRYQRRVVCALLLMMRHVLYEFKRNAVGRAMYGSATGCQVGTCTPTYQQYCTPDELFMVMNQANQSLGECFQSRRTASPLDNACSTRMCMCTPWVTITDVLSPGDGAIDFDPRVFARHSD